MGVWGEYGDREYGGEKMTRKQKVIIGISFVIYIAILVAMGNLPLAVECTAYSPMGDRRAPKW